MSDVAETEWTPWNGGACPVDGGRLVEVRRRYLRDPLIAPAGALRWSHDLYRDFGAEDIVAFRRLPDP